MPRQLLAPADDTASRALTDVQTAVTKVKELVTEGVSKGWTEEELTKKLNATIAEECKRIDNVGLREQMRKAFVAAARKWHYELKMTYRVLDANLAQQALHQPLGINVQDLLRKTPSEKMTEFRKVLDSGASPGIPIIKDYQQSVKLAVKAMSADPPKIYTGSGKFVPIRLRAEMAVRYAAAVENLQSLIDAGVKFCWISSHASCSPRCAPFQGRLYSLFQGQATVDGIEYGERGTIDGIPYRPINEALAGVNGDGNGCISGYNCRHRAVEYRRGDRPPQDYTEAQLKREYAVDQRQRAYENHIRQLKTEERQLRAAGMAQEASELRKKWRRLTLDYQIYSIEHDRAYYPYRCVIDRAEESEAGIEDGKLINTDIREHLEEKYATIPVTSIARTPAQKAIAERFDLKSNRVVITKRQFERHIAAGRNTHNDIYDRIKDDLPDILRDPDYIFEDWKNPNTVIMASRKQQAQIVIALNTEDTWKSNTIITIFGLSERRLQQNLRNKSAYLLYKKEET